VIIVPYLGSWKIDDYLVFPCNTHRADTGAAVDADGTVTYRVYEDETAGPVASGTMAVLDDANTTGFYTEQIQLTSASGFEKGKAYTIYIAATVNSVLGTMSHTFQIEAEVDSNIISDTTVARIGGDGDTLETLSDQIDNIILPSGVTTEEIADAVWDELASGHLGAGVFGRLVSEIQQHSYMQRTIVKPTGAIAGQGITAGMVTAGDVIQYEEIDISFVRDYELPDLTFYILYHYDATGDCDVKKADTDTTW
jgi:hypothetical protein